VTGQAATRHAARRSSAEHWGRSDNGSYVARRNHPSGASGPCQRKTPLSDRRPHHRKAIDAALPLPPERNATEADQPSCRRPRGRAKRARGYARGPRGATPVGDTVHAYTVRQRIGCGANLNVGCVMGGGSGRWGPSLRATYTVQDSARLPANCCRTF
jgi:hypothetical protein